VGSQTIPGGLTSAPISRSDRGRARAKLKDRRADGVKAVSRRRRWRACASLEAGRSPVYFTTQLLCFEEGRTKMQTSGDQRREIANACLS
jgi:hypothetical protein